ncbi:alpha/beta fold hydrolase [Sulfurimonas sp.]|uniref:alpha/beta hydrolase n=1 Tax=Sulfurimonas sp. TaxID=2022749 RepID=UPI0026187BBF|nr:alpha/beta fold hydrolase [Sulfurimonas sp.]
MIYVVFFLFTFLILFVAFYQWQYFMIFSPTYIKERRLCDKCELLSIKTDDGIELEGAVYEPANAGRTLLVFVGRSHDAVALMGRLSEVYKNVRVIAFNYRGYGKSGGVANEKNILSDGLKIAQLVQKHYGDFYLLGFSLGSNVAAFVAKKHNTKALFLVGAFDSVTALSKEKYPKLCCIEKLLRYKFPTDEYLQDVTAKTYLFVSSNDETIPLKNAQNLKESVKNLALYSELEGLSHKELLWDSKVTNKINKVIENG